MFVSIRPDFVSRRSRDYKIEDPRFDKSNRDNFVVNGYQTTQNPISGVSGNRKKPVGEDGGELQSLSGEIY